MLDDNTDILNKIDEFGLPIDRFAISETEFYQGTLGDCYYLSSLAAIAFLYPEIIEDLFLRGAPQQSLFLVKFYLHGEPVCIVSGIKGFTHFYHEMIFASIFSV